MSKAKTPKEEFEEMHTAMRNAAQALQEKCPDYVRLVDQVRVDGEPPRLQSPNLHEVIVFNGFDLWDASVKGGYPRFVKPQATEQEAIAWLTK